MRYQPRPRVEIGANDDARTRTEIRKSASDLVKYGHKVARQRVSAPGPDDTPGGVAMIERTCSVIENGKRCGKPHLARGFCNAHWLRWSRHGSPLGGGASRDRRDPRTRFWADVIQPAEADGCWLWSGLRNDEGYGLLSISGRHERAHRFSYELLVGPIPEDLQLDHRCHNADPTCRGGPTCRHRACVRPDHLEPATDGENKRRGKAGLRQREKTHCPQGHPYVAANTRWQDGRRWCRECARMHNRATKERARQRRKASQ